MNAMVSFKQMDSNKILDYLKKQVNGASIDSIINHSGAEKLRVYPIIFELIDCGKIKCIRRDNWGIPVVVAIYDFKLEISELLL